jgi:hypothetical protein
MNEYQEFAEPYLIGIGVRFRPEAWRDSYNARDKAVKKYAWAIPNDEAIAECVKFSPLIEIGAGLGYWAKLISEAGGDIIAFDAWVMRSGPCFKRNKITKQEGLWFDVEYGNEHWVKDHPDRTLFLCWPPYNTSMALNCLTHYRGNDLIYVGESWGGCCGCEEFGDKLKNEWKVVKNITIPQWDGLHDFFCVYERK